MGNLEDPSPQTTTVPSNPRSFSDFPEDVQLCILSFLKPSEVAAFSCASKRSLSLCRCDGKLWHSMCERRWGLLTQIKKWGNGKITYRLLYRTLDEWENLIGFWRRSGQRSPSAAATGRFDLPPLVFFEWGPSFVAGSRVSPSDSGTYEVVKAPFLWMGLSAQGEIVNFLHPDCRIDLSADFVNSAHLGFSEGDLVPVNVSFMGKCHVVVEENRSFGCSISPERSKKGFVSEDVIGAGDGSPLGSSPDRMMSEIYQYFANRTSPCGERRQRKREKGRQGRKKWEPEHFVKIVNCAPTPSRPLQGLWKGICDDQGLDFFLVVYDDVGGIACRRVGDSSRPFASYSPVFWASNTTSIESPFSPEEEFLYESRVHLQKAPSTEYKEVLRILYINSSYDLVLPDLAGTVNPWQVEGRIWQYGSGNFGFGFLRDNYIIDLKHIAQNGCLLDAAEL